jgi:hypothetical protein
MGAKVSGIEEDSLQALRRIRYKLHLQIVGLMPVPAVRHHRQSARVKPLPFVR